MEACIGLIRKRGVKETGRMTTGVAGPSTESGTDEFGNRMINFAPGMVADIHNDGDLTPFTPTRPGGTYSPFMDRQLRTIAAGGRVSYEQLTRDFSNGTYSSQRQGMLEDNAEFDWITELLVDLWLRELYQDFVTFMVLEDRIEAPGFWANPAPYLRVEWQGPPRPWIDPAKEATADTLSVLWGLDTRKRILNRRGYSFEETLQQVAEERRRAEELGLRLPDLTGDPEATVTEDDDAEPVSGTDAEADAGDVAKDGAGALNGHGRGARW
jgi:lambda family phage portal protein